MKIGTNAYNNMNMKNKPKTIGALQAIELVLYIMFVATAIQTIGDFGPEKTVNPALGVSLFLLLFVTSALICSSIAFAYPIILFFNENKRHEALTVVGWMIGWLIAFALLFVLYLLTYGPLSR